MSDSNDFPQIAPLPLPFIERLETYVERAIKAFPDPAAFEPIAENARRTIRLIDAIADARG